MLDEKVVKRFLVAIFILIIQVIGLVKTRMESFMNSIRRWQIRKMVAVVLEMCEKITNRTNVRNNIDTICRIC